jgi:hypothetical protein
MNRPYFEALFKKVPIYMIKKPELGLEGAYVRKINIYY